MSLISEISAIRSLTKDLRDTTVSEQTTRSIERIHDVLRTSVDSQGWHRVDWRFRGGGGTNLRPGAVGRQVPQGSYRGFNGHNTTGANTTVANSYRGFNERNTTVASSQININRTEHTGSINSSISKSVPQKYTSRFKSSSDKIDETILNTIILGKLNKFSPVNYDEIKNFMCQILDSGETTFLKEFMKLVFQKATTEEIFCPLYAKLLSELSERYKFLLSEMVVLYKEYMAIFEDVHEKDTINYDDIIKRTTETKYRLGYSVFLAELVKNNVLDCDLLLQTIRTIVDQIPKAAASSELAKVGEEYAECLYKIVHALNEGKSEDICKICKLIEDEVPCRIYPYTVKKSDNMLTMKARFALLNIYEKLQKK